MDPKAESPDSKVSEQDENKGDKMDKSESTEESNERPSSPQTNRRRRYKIDVDLRTLCEMNGISESKFVKNPGKFEHLDLFMIASPDIMSQVSHFSHAKSICIMKMPNLRRIQGLDHLDCLESLWVTECKVEIIEGLRGCAKLENLHLSGNRISKIQGLNSLSNLQLLWLNDNKLSTLDGLSSLVNLRVLWACRNRLTRIDDSLQYNENLEELNVADNKIGCFKQLLNLTQCKNLRSLSLSDPHFGDNPVCALCNYDTYVTFHLTQLTSLDMEIITDEAKSLSQAIYMKKKMYYNMRTKMVKRHAGYALSKAQQLLDQAVANVMPLMIRLQREHKAITSKLDEWEFFEDSYQGDTHLMERFQTKGDECRDSIEEIREYRKTLDNLLYAFTQRLHAMSSSCVAKLMVEFDTGGNVRLEEGSPADVWHSSCSDLCQNRYNPTKAVDTLSISRIEVKRVIRVHNRFMRYRLEHVMLEMLKNEKRTNSKEKGKEESGEHRRNMEYLFYLGDANICQNFNWALHVCEDGFPSSEEWGTVLSSAITGPSENQFQHGSDKDILWPTGQALIVKTYIGNNLQLKDSQNLQEQIQQAKKEGYQTVSVGEGPAINFKWYILDPSLLLPEYIVDFDYVLNHEEELNKSPEVIASWSHLEKAMMPRRKGYSSPKELWRSRELVDMFPYLPLLKRFLKQMKHHGIQAAQEGPIEQRANAAVTLEPIVSGKPTLFMLTKESLLCFANIQDPAKVVYLNLHGQAIRKFEKLSYFPNLEYLILSFNELKSLSGIGGMESSPKLKHIDVSYNLIDKLNDLEADCTPEGLSRVVTCYIQSNKLDKSSLSSFDIFANFLPQLRTLDMQDNALCKARSYRASILRSCGNLEVLDGIEITKEERENVQHKATLTDILIYNCWLQRSHYGGANLPKSQHQRPPAMDGSEFVKVPEDNAWKKEVEKLDLSHNQIQVISSLHEYPNIKKVSFSKNDISVIQGLSHNRYLEELNFEGNEINVISNLHANTRLRRLDLGSNQLKSVSNLSALGALSQLSLESNQIDNLEGLSDLQCLMELYLGNNTISNINQIHHLKTLPKLIILDLSGNPVCSESNYRLYALYNLKKLKVLDGLSIHSSEVIAAKERYSGRLTDQMLADHLGHTSFHIVRELELLNKKIRDVSILGDVDFSGLVEINLTHNMLQEFGHVGKLPALQVLCLNENRIESLYKQHKSKESPPPSDDAVFFQNLKTLQLGNNKITDISALELGRMPLLTHLDLQNNNITQVTGLNVCTSLKELILDKNKIRQLQENSLAGLISLRKLKMQENGLKALSHFKALPALRYLNLAANRISDLAELDKLAQVGKIADLSLANNPVSRKLAYKPSLLYLFSTLQYIDGEEVDYGERERAELMFLANDRPFINFNSEVKSPGLIAPNFQGQSGNSGAKVPVKLTSVNFETLSVHGEDSGLGMPMESKSQYFPPAGKRRY